jgi:hypothetical protein
MKRLFLFCWGMTILPLLCSGAIQADEPRLYLLQAERVTDLKEAYSHPTSPEKTPGASALAKKIIDEADKALGHPIFTIATNAEKIRIIRGNDPHDYFSLAPYFWPDPSKPDGIPYIHRDGVKNPEKDRVSDALELSRMVSTVRYLALAYHMTGEEKYAVAASRFLRGFFLDPSTRMNPNVEHAQMIMGVNLGRGSGMIDVFCLSFLPDCITLISPSKSWTKEDRQGMTTWWHDYATWLQESPEGQHEMNNPNNHGFYYDLQLSGVLIGSGNPDAAREHLKNHLTKRLDSQITPTGEMPREEARPTSWHYCNYAVTGLCEAGMMARSLGINIWNNEAPDGSGSVKKAMLFLIPFIDHREKWKFSEIGVFSPSSCEGWLGIASAIYDDPAIREAQQKYAPMDKLSLSNWLLVPGSGSELLQGDMSAQDQRK